jgi:mRNA interferase RelE/StbE
MTYELAFKATALKEWKRLGATVREQFKKKLAERLEHPHVPSAALSGAANLYKIKLRQSGYRLVYSVEDHIVTVTVIAVGKRDRNAVYDAALSRLRDQEAP